MKMATMVAILTSIGGLIIGVGGAVMGLGATMDSKVERSESRVMQRLDRMEGRQIETGRMVQQLLLRKPH